MATENKPRICDILGVEVGERFRISMMREDVDFWIIENGTFMTDPDRVSNSSFAMMMAIEHPEYVVHKSKFCEVLGVEFGDLFHVMGDERRWLLTKHGVSRGVNLVSNGWKHTPQDEIKLLRTIIEHPNRIVRD